MNNQKIGVLDIGSNSVRLLVSKVENGRAFSLHTDKITSRLMSGMRDGLLAPDALSRTIEAVDVLTKRAYAHGADLVVGFGTSAMRDGQNAGAIVDRGRAIGASIRIISGEEEAELGYAGAAPEGRRLVIDIGGGSTELLVGADGHVLRSFSAQVGAVRLYDVFQGFTQCDPLMDAARALLLPAWRAVLVEPFDGATGVGGTITSLAAMCQRLVPYDPCKVTGFVLTAPCVRDWLHELCAMPVEARRLIPGLNPERADIIPFGTAILAAFFDLSGVPRLHASDCDNLLGYVEKYFSISGG